jgi:hypothetical protein
MLRVHSRRDIGVERGTPWDLKILGLGKVDRLKIQDLDEPGGYANTSSAVGHFTSDREAKA